MNRSSVHPAFQSVLRVFLAFSLVLGVGCIFDPDKDDDDPPPPVQYPALDSPQRALLNLKLAWENRDSTRTRQVLDDEYEGTAYTPESTYVFSKDQEVATVWALGRDPYVVATSMFLYPESTWVRESFTSDPEGWATIRLLKGVRLEVITSSTTYRAQNSDIEYKFKPEVSGADTTWRIVKWTENALAL